MSAEKCLAIKSDLALKYSEKAGITQKEAKQRIDDIVGIMVGFLADQSFDGVMFRNLFTIEKTVKPARRGKMPINGVSYETPSAQKLKISTGKDLYALLNKR